MHAALTIVVAIVGLACVSGHHEGSSPCAERFEYEAQHKTLGQWEGTFKMKDDYTLHGVWLRMFLDRPVNEVKVLSPAGFEVVAGDDKSLDFLIKNRDFILKKGKEELLKVVVQFNQEESASEESKEKGAVPRLLGYRLNGRVQCPVGEE